MWARVIGSVAIRVYVETWDRREKSPDCERARKPVPKAMEEEMRYVEALERNCVLVVQLRRIGAEVCGSVRVFVVF